MRSNKRCDSWCASQAGSRRKGSLRWVSCYAAALFVPYKLSFKSILVTTDLHKPRISVNRDSDKNRNGSPVRRDHLQSQCWLSESCKRDSETHWIWWFLERWVNRISWKCGDNTHKLCLGILPVNGSKL